MTHTGDLLLYFNVIKSDEIYVLDFNRIAAYTYNPMYMPGELTPDFEGYFQSRVPLSEYSGGYALPECIVANVVSRNRLSHNKLVNRKFLSLRSCFL